ncbi:MAG: helix-turn-helix domain-containing protein [Lachnospiraceae bacterium]|nr:helix-turn-helix domain-containing protein [Ruminococcus sp.]MCM1277068.1 helix-turn-helix domain-containing protein [Lachnospiraceae bacterium]
MFNEYSNIVTVDELCEMLRIGRNKAYDLLRNGEVKAFRSGRLWIISKSSVEEFVKKGNN